MSKDNIGYYELAKQEVKIYMEMQDVDLSSTQADKVASDLAAKIESLVDETIPLLIHEEMFK